jgi:SAM-dependent methyltransferase
MPDEPLGLSEVSDFLDGASLKVSDKMIADDPMYAYNPSIYYVAGQSALRSIRLAMLAARRDTANSILDFACGAGRVMRVLRAAFPDAALTACDVRPERIEFCEKQFGATPVLGTQQTDQICDLDLGGPFDVIWCGSLLTHVDSNAWVEFVKLWGSALKPGGVVVYTVYGRYIVNALRTGSKLLGLSPQQVEDVLRDYDETGFGFRPVFAPEMNFGDCVVSRTWACAQLERAPDLELLLYTERGWLDDQDVVACVKQHS